MESLLKQSDIENQLQFFFEKLDIPQDLDMSKITLREYTNSLNTVEDEIPDHLSCKICMCLVHEPIECKNCKNAIFCDSCIQGWLEKDKQKECPCCRQKFGTWHGSSKPSKAKQIEIDYAQIVVYDFGVKKIINYKNIKKHFEDSFTKGLRYCPLDCGKQLSIKDAQSHYDNCENVLLQCPKSNCRKIIQRREMKSHDCVEGYPCITPDGQHPELKRCKHFGVCELCLQVIEAKEDIEKNIMNLECGMFCKLCDQVIVRTHPGFVGNDSVVACFDCKKIHAAKQKDCTCKLIIIDCAIYMDGCKSLEYIREGHDVDQCACRCGTFCRTCKKIIAKKNNGHEFHESEHGSGCHTCGRTFFQNEGHCFHVYTHGARCCHDGFIASARHHDFFINKKGKSACRHCAWNTQGENDSD